MKKGICLIAVTAALFAGSMMLSACLYKGKGTSVKAQQLFEEEAGAYLKDKYGIDVTGTAYYTQSNYDAVNGMIDGDPYNYYYDGDLYTGYDYHITCSEKAKVWE